MAIYTDSAGNAVDDGKNDTSQYKVVQTDDSSQARIDDILGKLEFAETSPYAKIKSLSYPINKTNNHFVKFFINIDEESKIVKQNLSTVTDTVNNSDQNRTDQQNSYTSTSDYQIELRKATDATKAGMDKFKGKGQDGLIGPIPGMDIPSMFPEIQEWAAGLKDISFTKKLKRLAASISLYTPAGINASYDMSYEMDDSKLVLAAQDETIKSMTDAMKSPNTAKFATGISRIVATAANSSISILSRTALNPRKAMLFKHVEPRVFTFDYQFAPQSAKEAQVVADIIFMFKYFSHPEVLEGYGQFLNIYPAEFDIEYYFTKDDGSVIQNQYINKISSCVLESVKIGYANNGSYQSLAKGEPVITNMSLRFREIEILHQDRIAKGY